MVADDVVKYHRTVATYVNILTNSDFRISKLSEPEPTLEMLIEQPGLKEDGNSRMMENRKPDAISIGRRFAQPYGKARLLIDHPHSYREWNSGKILKTSLSHEDEAKLQAALSAARS
jgi:hypothetical protein